jgi:hypothetical protein
VWYSTPAVRRWSIQAAIALLLALGGLVGSALLVRQIALLREQNLKLEAQTTLLREQNGKLDQQTITAEAQRRAALSAEAFALIHAIGAEAQSRSVIARVVALTRAATPFYYVRVDAYVGETASRRAWSSPLAWCRRRSPR